MLEYTAHDMDRHYDTRRADAIPSIFEQNQRSPHAAECKSGTGRAWREGQSLLLRCYFPPLNRRPILLNTPGFLECPAGSCVFGNFISPKVVACGSCALSIAEVGHHYKSNPSQVLVDMQ